MEYITLHCETKCKQEYVTMLTLTTNHPGKVHQHDENSTGARKRVTSHRLVQRRRSSDVDVSSLAMRVRI